jgi:hypothetical protein
VFDRVRVALHLDSNQIAVVDRATETIRVFDHSGRLVREIGRGGEGPGEFRQVNSVWIWRDTLVVADDRLGRVSYYDSAGRYLDQVTLPPDHAGLTSVVGMFATGDFLLERRDARRGTVARAGVLPADSVRWYRAPRGLDRLVLLGTAVAGELYGHPWSGGLALGEVIFGSRAHAALQGDTLLLARGGVPFEVELIGPDGTLAGRFGLRSTPRETSAEDRARYTAWRLDNAPRNADTSAWRRVFEDAPMRETLPATASLLVDPSGNIWVERFTPPWDPQRWAVFDRARRWLGDVAMPEGASLMEVRNDDLLVAHRDDVGFETIALYDLEKPGANAFPR